ncbi:hypothetical protein DVJ83_10460 [Deinococcus wulumuqiensis]|uniref:Uncharacterized protein n=1 Tax=Deinococcus wulumuqiensis TaxID=980427 RepID=A0A345IIF8_9DEIO|nr:hypothetical protein DVJ83_10460 [Deinococcus wulumuqiensis]
MVVLLCRWTRPGFSVRKQTARSDVQATKALPAPARAPPFIFRRLGEQGSRAGHPQNKSGGAPQRRMVAEVQVSGRGL